MLKKAQKFISFGLACVISVSMFAGCGQSDIEPIVPEEQIFKDSYERNPEINDTMLYSADYIVNKKSTVNWGDNGKYELLNLFNHPRVQIDDWPSIIIGKTKMGEITQIVDEANIRFVETKTQEIIDKRTADIKAEYEAAKKKAEAAGKTYTKPMKEPVKDDIHFDPPYEYYIELPKGSNEYPYEEYMPRRLQDPSTYDHILLHVEKYHIPYVTIEFRASQIYNMLITQESDWICNGIYAADVKSFIDAQEAAQKKKRKKGEEVVYPEYVDVDGMNKAAKKNIVMNGNIQFDGEGFTWESLRILCSALKLEMMNERYTGFSQSSEGQFTYYMLTVPLSPFEDKYLTDPEGNIYIPMARYLATFDRDSQRCLNWAVDTHSQVLKYAKEFEHTISDPVNINVHEYTVDTTDYAGMRETVDEWIKNNREQTTTKYCMLTEKDEVFGVLDSSMKNAFIEATIDGVDYVCLDNLGEKAHGEEFGLYIAKDDLIAAGEKDSDEAKAEYIKKKSVILNPACALMYGAKDTVICEFKGKDMTEFEYAEEKYYVVEYETTDDGLFSDVSIINESQIEAWIMMLIKTYNLNTEQSQEVANVFKEEGCTAAKRYVIKMFKDAEDAQKQEENQKHDEASDISGSTTDDTINNNKPGHDKPEKPGGSEGDIMIDDVSNGDTHYKDPSEEIKESVSNDIAGKNTDIGKFAEKVSKAMGDQESYRITYEAVKKSNGESDFNDGDDVSTTKMELDHKININVYGENAYGESRLSGSTEANTPANEEKETEEVNYKDEYDVKNTFYYRDGICYIKAEDSDEWTNNSEIKEPEEIATTIVLNMKDFTLTSKAVINSGDEGEYYVTDTLASFVMRNKELFEIAIDVDPDMVETIFKGGTVVYEFDSDHTLKNISIKYDQDMAAGLAEYAANLDENDENYQMANATAQLVQKMDVKYKYNITVDNYGEYTEEDVELPDDLTPKKELVPDWSAFDQMR